MTTQETKASETVILALDSLDPLHEVRDETKLAMLVASMDADGWTGRPLLVQDTGEGWYQAWTGSHRIAAAREAGIDSIPCVVIDNPTLDPHGSDSTRARELSRAGLDAAADLMSQEEE